MRRGIIFTLSLLVLSVAVPNSATAADIVVKRSDDPAIPANFNYRCDAMLGCSLRQAVLIANNRPGADQILLGKKTYTLTQTTSSTTVDGFKGPLFVDDALTVKGVDTSLSRIRWNAGFQQPHTHQVFLNAANLDLESLTVSDGRGESGGCINARDDLTLRHVVIENCRATSGGAIRLNVITRDHPALFSIYSSILRNNTASYGGAIAASGGTTIISDSSQIVGNTANIRGGALALDSELMFSSNDPLNWYNNGGESLIADNTSGGDGGAISVGARTRLVVANLLGGIAFERNVASGNGGAVAFSSTSNEWPKAHFQGVRFDDNAATNGGAISARDGGLLIESSDFNRNQAVSGRGGALQIEKISSSVGAETSIRESAFNQNLSASLGGAISNQCQVLWVRNASMYNNSTAAGDGTAVASSGNTKLIHVTTNGHNSVGSPTLKATLYKTFSTLCGVQPFQLANSIVGGADSCYSPIVGVITSAGGNQFGPQAGGCTILSGVDHWNTDPSVFGLSLGGFGTTREVLGWDNDGVVRPQVNFGVAANCDVQDVLGRLRSDGACDAGAFEQQ